jgi:hypothetical protein
LISRGSFKQQSTNYDRSRTLAAFVFLLVTLLLAAEARAQTLHAILIGDTSDGTIGPGITANLQKINSFLNVVETIAEIPVARYEIKDAAFNCKAIVDQVRSIDVSSNDVVLFYYSGHGFRRDTSQTIFPEFDCRRSADETRAALQEAGKPRIFKPVWESSGESRISQLERQVAPRSVEPLLRTFVSHKSSSGAEDATRRRMETKERHNDYKTAHPHRLRRNGFELWHRTRRSLQHRR